MWKKYSFMNFFGPYMFLDSNKDSSTNFKNVLIANFDKIIVVVGKIWELAHILKKKVFNPIYVKSSCPKCKSKITSEDNSKIIKLPEILVFTIEKYIGETNRISIKSNKKIDVKDYVENQWILKILHMNYLILSNLLKTNYW